MKTLLILTLALASCSTTSTTGAPGPRWSSSKTYAPKDTIVLRSVADWPDGVGTIRKEHGQTVIDGGQVWRISGSKMPGKSDQKESNEPVIRIQMPNVTLRGFEIYESKDGITTNKPGTVFEDLIFLKICEDAINPMAGSDGGSVRRCYFKGAYDKTLQWNAAKDVHITNNVFIGGINAIRLMGTSSDDVEANRFYGNETAIQVTRKGVLNVRPAINLFYGVGQKFKTEDGGVINFK